MLDVRLKVTKSEEDIAVEFLGVTAHFPERCENVAELPLLVERPGRAAGQLLELLLLGAASASSKRKVAGERGFAQTAVMGGFARVVLKPLDRFFAGKAAQSPRRVVGGLTWWVSTLRLLSPRPIKNFSD